MAIMVYCRNDLRPANIEPEGQLTTINGHIFLQGISPNTLKEKERVFWCTENAINDLNQISGYGRNKYCVITTEPAFVDTADSDGLPFMFHINKACFSELQYCKDVEAQIYIDMRAYRSIYLNSRNRMIFDKALNVDSLCERIKSSYDLLVGLFDLNDTFNFNLLYLSEVNQIRRLTGFSTTFAYKNKLACILYNRFHWQCEAHEFTHIILFNNYGETCFLLQEGLAGITYDLCVLKDNYNRYNCELTIRIRGNSMNCVNISKYLADTDSNQVFTGWDYIYAASFVLWSYKRFGMKLVLTLYKMLRRTNNREKNVDIFKRVTNLDIIEAERLWMKQYN